MSEVEINTSPGEHTIRFWQSYSLDMLSSLRGERSDFLQHDLFEQAGRWSARVLSECPIRTQVWLDSISEGRNLNSFCVEYEVTIRYLVAEVFRAPDSVRLEFRPSPLERVVPDFLAAAFYGVPHGTLFAPPREITHVGDDRVLSVDNISPETLVHYTMPREPEHHNARCVLEPVKEEATREVIINRRMRQ